MTPSTILWANGKSFLVVSCSCGLSIAIMSLETKYLKVEGKHILIPLHGNPIPTQQQTHTSGNWTPGRATGRQAYALRKASHCLYSLLDLRSISLFLRPFPPPVFDHLQYANMEREIWSCVVMSDRQRVDTWGVVPNEESQPDLHTRREGLESCLYTHFFLRNSVAFMNIIICSWIYLYTQHNARPSIQTAGSHHLLCNLISTALMVAAEQIHI